RLRSDGNAEWEIMRRPRGNIAALVATPIQENLFHFDSAPEQRAVVAIGWQEHVVLAHGTRDPDRDCFLAERYGIGAEPPSPLESHRFQVKAAGEHHGFIESGKQSAVGAEIGQPPRRYSVRPEIAPATHLET